jgi:hypothetical protein
MVKTTTAGLRGRFSHKAASAVIPVVFAIGGDQV